MKEDLKYKADDGLAAEKRKKFIRTLFDSIVPTYDSLNRILSMGIDRGWRKKVIIELKKNNPLSVLDVCSGTGDLSNQIYKNSFKLTSLDFSIPMLILGKQKKWLHENVVAGDATLLPFKEKSFDAITISFGIRNLPNVKNFIIESEKILSSNGTLIILELTRPNSKIVAFFYNLYLKKILPFVGGLISGQRDAYRYLSGTISTFFSSEELSEIIRENGFDSVEAYQKTFGVATIFVAKKNGLIL